jgi:phage-related protein
VVPFYWDAEHSRIYIATLADAIYVLHAFQKKTPAASKRDFDLAAARFRELMRRIDQ